MSCHLVTCLPEEDWSNRQSSSTSTGIFLSHIRNRDNKELSKRSDCSVLQGIKVGSVEEHNQYSSILPQESPIQFPQESWNPSPQAVSLSPVDSGSLSSQSTNASPGFIQRVISLPGYNWVILSQKPRKERPRRSLLIPSEVY